MTIDQNARRDDELSAIVDEKIENLRIKLLDLTARNPLIRTRLSLRSNSHMRVVDELPDVLYSRLASGRTMRFVPLPDLDEELPDESTPEFMEALAAARQTDELFREACDKLDHNSADYLDRNRVLERSLMDRVRDELGLIPRQAGRDANLTQHARIHGVTPSFELPEPTEGNEERKHTDNDVQTLQLPRDLTRRLNAILSKGRSWAQETGINVLHAAIGFLEWEDVDSRDKNFSPLIVLPVKLSSHKTRGGLEFRVTGTGDPAELNGVLAERLRLVSGIDLPAFEGGSIEGYMKSVADLAPSLSTWRVRRQVVFGVFPSARLAMYHDLNSSETSFADNEVIRDILAGTDPTDFSGFARDYDIDEPPYDKKLPIIVADADSSQVSTLIDLQEGKNLAVEGPPGTGKSQTIVNAIAAALEGGKKVLFVAEKTAALDVVKARLEAVGLGDFILPLQAGRSSKEEVIQSIRKRLATNPGQRRDSLELTVDRLKRTRDRLAEYVDLLTIEFEQTGLTIHEILGRGILTEPILADLPAEVKDATHVDERAYTKGVIEEIIERGNALDRVLSSARDSGRSWSGTSLFGIAPFQANVLLAKAASAANAEDTLAELQEKLVELGFDEFEPTGPELLKTALTNLDHEGGFAWWDRLATLYDDIARDEMTAFAEGCRTCQATVKELRSILRDPLSGEIVTVLDRVDELGRETGLSTLNLATARENVRSDRRKLKVMTSVIENVEAFAHHSPDIAEWKLSDIAAAARLVGEFDRSTLALRNRALEEVVAIDVLQDLVARGRTLVAERKELSGWIRTDTSASVDELLQEASLLRDAGVFSFFSGDVRHAKKHYKALSIRGRFDANVADKDLVALAEHLADVSQFVSNPQCIAIFGVHFRGLDTDFARFEKLHEYLDRVDEDFVGPDRRGIRDFLKGGDVDLIRAIPDVSVLTIEMNVGKLALIAGKIKTKCEATEASLSELEGLSNAFCDPPRVEIAEISELAQQFRELQRSCDLLDSDELARQLLGEDFAGWRSDVSVVDAALTFIQEILGIPGSAAAMVEIATANRIPELYDLLVDFVEQSELARKLVDDVCREGKINLDGRTVEFPRKRERLHAMAADREGLFAQMRVAAARSALEDEGFEWIVEHILDQKPNADNFAGYLNALIARYLVNKVYDRHGEILTDYDGQTLDQLRERLSMLDREVIKLSRHKLRSDVTGRADPPVGNGRGRRSEYTEMALILNEVEKRKRHIPVRDLTRRAGTALLELKPCWMMSPLAVAQYIEKDTIEFDLCIIDEASQMPPEDSIGALYRSRQVMIVGDTNQLPPTDFFKKMLDDEEEDDETETVLEESILESAKNTFRPPRILRWHYRSRHSGLISFSNRMIYDNGLIVFPSPDETRPDMGVSLVHVAGRYKSSLNIDEARVVVDATLDFMKAQPDRSLGVVTLNKTQADLIEQLLRNDVIPNNRAAQRYVDTWDERNDGLETFFVKNLENVQGDERDVIYISTVYGAAEPGGAVHQRFGPINGIAGQRRLNPHSPDEVRI